MGNEFGGGPMSAECNNIGLSDKPRKAKRAIKDEDERKALELMGYSPEEDDYGDVEEN